MLAWYCVVSIICFSCVAVMAYIECKQFDRETKINRRDWRNDD